METIRVTFPKEISEIDVRYNLVMGLFQLSKRICNVNVVEETIDGEVLYLIEAESALDFYQIGIIASGLLSQYK